MSLVIKFYFTSSMLNMFQTLIYHNDAWSNIHKIKKWCILASGIKANRNKTSGAQNKGCMYC